MDSLLRYDLCRRTNPRVRFGIHLLSPILRKVGGVTMGGSVHQPHNLLFWRIVPLRHCYRVLNVQVQFGRLFFKESARFRQRVYIFILALKVSENGTNCFNAQYINKVPEFLVYRFKLRNYSLFLDLSLNITGFHSLSSNLQCKMMVCWLSVRPFFSTSLRIQAWSAGGVVEVFF